MLALRAGLTALIYDKTTQLSISAVDKSQSVTIMSTDIERILHGLITLQEIWAIVVQVAVVSALLGKQIGAAIAVPFVVGAGEFAML
jgi:ATP-binding cassette, subfamily C (CFTR/MRP), member 1